MTKADRRVGDETTYHGAALLTEKTPGLVDLKSKIEGKNICFVSFRLLGLDGVTLEAEEWARAVYNTGGKVIYQSGESLMPDFVKGGRSVDRPEFHFKGTAAAEITHDVMERGDFEGNELFELNGIKDKIKKDILASIKEYDIFAFVPENVLAFPGNLALGKALVETANELHLPVIPHHHDFYWERKRFKVQPDSRLQEWLDFMITGLELQVPVVINSKQQKELKRRYQLNALVAPNVRDFHHPPVIESSKVLELRRHCSIGVNDLLLLSPVRLVERKFLELTLELAGRIKQANTGRKVVLAFAHPGVDEKSTYPQKIINMAASMGVETVDLKDQIKENAASKTEKNRRLYSIYAAYAASDLVLYTPKIEGFGNTLLEAILLRKPVLINPYEIYKIDIRPKGVQCIEVDLNDLDGTVRRANKILQNPAERNRMAEHNIEVCKKHFSHPILYPILAKAFDLLLKQAD